MRNTDISDHLLVLYSLVVGSEAKTILEIGVGQSTYILTAAANKSEGQLYSIDLKWGAHLRLFPEGDGVLEKEPRHHFIESNSLDVKWDKPIDFFFLDSGHTYDLTLAELKKYMPYVRKGGFVGVHDTREEWVDCRRALFDFIKDKPLERKEFTNQNGFTILRKI